MQLQKVPVILFIVCVMLAACVNHTNHRQTTQACKSIIAYNNYAADSTVDIIYSNVTEIDTSVAAIECTIRSKETRLPIHASIVSLAGFESLTDSSGACQFAGIARGDYVLKITAPGYQCIELQNLHFGSGWVRTITVQMSKE